MSVHSFQLAEIPPQHIRHWQSCYVVFDQRNGETHLIEGPISVILERLMAGPASRTDLLSQVQSHYDDTPNDLDEFLTGVLAELRRHQLIETSMNCSE